MADPLPIPYKDKYPLWQYMPMLTQSSPWKKYAADNDKEAAALLLHAQRKIDQVADVTPANLTHTYFGNAVLMTILTLPGGKQGQSRLSRTVGRIRLKLRRR